MELVEIRESGLLELYVIGELDKTNSLMVEEHIIKFPELKGDVIAIGNALEAYAKIHKIEVSEAFKPELLKKILDNNNGIVRSIKTEKKKNIWLPAAACILAVISAVSLYQYSQVSNQLADLQKEKQLYEEDQAQILEQKEREIAKFKSLHTAQSKVLTLTPTDKFKTAQVVMYLDESSKKNFIELKDMPAISSAQSYQLWSLKADVAPIPLTVFQGDETIFEVAFEEGTGTYAITIEPFGGQTAPSLEDLIGTIAV